MKYSSLKVLQVSKIDTFENGVDVICNRPGSLSTIDAYDHTGSGQGVYFLSSKELLELSFSTLTLLESARIVLTDDEFPLNTLLRSLIKAYKGQKNDTLRFMQSSDWNHKPCLAQISKADFEDSYKLLSTGILSASHADTTRIGAKA